MIYKFVKQPFKIKIQLIKRFFWFLNNLFYGEFGKHSLLEKPLLIYNKKNIYIGSNVTIRPNLRIEPIKNWIGQKFNPKIVIGNNTNIEQNCHITCANKVLIGNYVAVMGYTCISDIEHNYEDIDKGILQQSLTVKETIIGDECFIGMGARIMPGVKLGRHCIVGANCVVNKSIPDYCVVVGVPCRIIKRYNFKNNKWQKTNNEGEFLSE